MKYVPNSKENKVEFKEIHFSKELFVKEKSFSNVSCWNDDDDAEKCSDEWFLSRSLQDPLPVPPTVQPP